MIMSMPVSPQVQAEWAYSGKALRMDCVKNAIITLLVFIALIVVGAVLKKFVEAPGTVIVVLWLLALVGLAGIWGLYALRFRNKTKIRYLLTVDRLEMTQGTVKKSMELIHVDDLILEQSMTDKLVNGGVGTVVASATGKGNASKIYVLKLEGVEDPQDVYDTVNKARIAVRQRHGIATVRGVER